MLNANNQSCCDPQRYHKIYFVDSYLREVRRAFCNKDWPFWFVLSRDRTAAYALNSRADVCMFGLNSNQKRRLSFEQERYRKRD
jgi:hypothetical protein